MILPSNIVAAHPPRLPLPNHVHLFVLLDRTMGSLKFPKDLFRFHPSFDGSVILFQHIIQVLHRPVPAPSPQDLFLFQYRNRRLVDRSLVGVDDTGLGMR